MVGAWVLWGVFCYFLLLPRLQLSAWPGALSCDLPSATPFPAQGLPPAPPRPPSLLWPGRLAPEHCDSQACCAARRQPVPGPLAGRALGRSHEASRPSPDQEQSRLQKGNRKQPVGARPWPPGPHSPTVSGAGVSPGWLAREPRPVEGGVPGRPLVLEPPQPLVWGSDPRAAGGTAPVACKRLPQVCRTRVSVAWREGELGPEQDTG